DDGTGALGTFTSDPAGMIMGSGPTIALLGQPMADSLLVVAGRETADVFSCELEPMVSCTVRSALPMDRGDAAALTFGQRLFMFAGQSAVDNRVYQDGVLFELPSLAQSSSVPTLLSTRTYPGVVQVGNFILVVGGRDADDVGLDSLEVSELAGGP